VVLVLGKSRVENLSVLLFSVIMALAAVFLLYQSSLVLADGLQHRPTIHIDAVSISILGFTIVVQTVAYFVCRMISKKGGRGATGVEAIAQDHMNDVVCSSVGLCAAIIAAFESAAWFTDSIGGILISVYIFSRWATVCYGQSNYKRSSI
jgi:divalent metal cation (Fe/Co/Zn/Cd) transporter